MKILNRAVLFAFALSSVSGVALAGGDKAEAGAEPAGAAGQTGAMSDSGGSLSFGDLDKDNNTFIDAEEAAAAGVEIDAGDKNYDGRLDQAEWEQAKSAAERSGGGEPKSGATETNR